MIERDEIVDRLQRFYQEVGTPPPAPPWKQPARPWRSRLAPAFAAVALLIVGAVVAINLQNARRTVILPPVRSSPAPIPKAQVSAAQFFDPVHGWGLTADGLFSTADGGATWTNISPSALAKPGIAYFLDSRHGWVSSWDLHGTAGSFESVFLIFKTNDGGKTWQQHDLHLPGYQVGDGSLYFVDQSHGWLVAVNTTSANFSDGRLFRTEDGGVTWQELTIPNGYPVRFLNARTGWNVGPAQLARPGHDTLYLTRDGGATWHAQPIALPSGLSNTFLTLPTFVDPRHGVLPVTFPAQRTEAFYISNDGGLSWQLKATEQANVLGGEKITLPSSPMPVAVTGQLSWVVAWATHLEVETNGNNVAIDPEGFVQVDELSFVSSEVGWALTTPSGSCAGFKAGCVTYQYVIRTFDGGHTWAPIDIP